MNPISVVAALIFRTTSSDTRELFATERGYGEWRGWWEFPGGKIEHDQNGNATETPEAALVREIREELATTVRVDERVATVEYDYPAFHLSMQCFACEIVSGKLELLEHENAAWLTKETLRSVKWLPADEEILPKLEQFLSHGEA